MGTGGCWFLSLSFALISWAVASMVASASVAKSVV